MAKKNTASGGGRKKPAPVKKTAASSGEKNMKREAATLRSARASADPTSTKNQIIPYVLGVLALFGAVCFFFPNAMGVVGKGLQTFFFGVLGPASLGFPLLAVYLAVRWKDSVENHRVGARLILSLVEILLVSVLIHAFAPDEIRSFSSAEIIKTLWTMGVEAWSGGGVIGGTLGILMLTAFDFVGTLIITIAAILIFGLFLFGDTPRKVWLWISYRIKCRNDAMEQAREEQEQRRREVLPDDPYIPVRVSNKSGEKKEKEHGKNRKHIFDQDIDMDPHTDSDAVISTAKIDTLSPEGDGLGDGTPEPPKEPVPVTASPKTAPEPEKGDVLDPELDWKQVFTEKGVQLPDGADAGISAAVAEAVSAPVPAASKETAALTEESEPQEEPASKSEETVKDGRGQKMLYFFPSLDLLHDDEPFTAADEGELRANAKRLVETLNSFNVHTKVMNITRGPTITRYELQPEAGTRVRSIANLVDDISLSLATTGVRIEAPIPGKSVVGIEVPNREPATVYLRGLLESSQFTSAASKLTACLGRDVAGAAVYFDIAKMPHMLIAGATGMGKSVSLNSIIVSLLYKATPDEVKMILIDPKKVELNIYNNLPHLLVPVVSDPKKAAGSLSWAVTEMERRFNLIEDVGVRDIKGYNTLTANDEEREFLPQIVIVIDELADLMMTAPDDVEKSICRLAQKARAAGMHLIIGTQRPSVDVITGLIKANIPSRIAFTVASQVDSRTIIDIGGAEKLIGRGDMLFAPVGFSKPVRVQGSFVSEGEIEKVVDFIKSHSGAKQEYASDVIDSIERAAAQCGGKKGVEVDTEDGEEGSDPMLRPALELAVRSGKISTSLIQRKLSLGYGRAAKLIDRMEELGYVSAPEGQKPRTVLITQEQFMEMVVRDEDIG